MSVFLVSGLVAGLRFQPHSDTRRPASIEEPMTRVSTNASAAAPVAQTEAYSFSREIHAKIENQAPLLDLTLHGRVWATVLSQDARSKVVALQFEMKSDHSKLLTSHLPFIIEMDSNYAIQRIRAQKPSNSHEEDELNLMKDFATLYAFRSNEDTTGKYNYAWSDDGVRGVKKKLQYEGKKLAGVSIKNSLHEVTLNKIDHQIEKIVGLDETSFSGEVGAGMKTTSSYVIVKLASSYHPKLEVNEKILSQLQDQSEQLQSQFSRVQVKDYSLLVAELENIKLMNKNQRLSLFHEFVKTLKADPSKVDEFRKKIESMSGEAGLMAFGIGVLATAGSEHAQTVLTEWYQNYSVAAKNADLGHTILNAFSTANAALSADSRKFLMGVAADGNKNPELADNAAFALGSSLKKSDDEAVRSQLNSLYAGAASVQARATVLDAIGNSGDSHFLPTVQAALNGADGGVKEKAVFALRYMDPSVAAPLLNQAYGDANPSVRQAAIRAISFQNDLKPYLSTIQSCASRGEQGCSVLLGRLNNS